MIHPKQRVTNRNKTKKNQTKKNKTNQKMISTEDVGLKPFEEKFEKTFKKGSLIKSSDLIKKEFTTKLLSNFAPTSIKPENDFYSYINYQWLKNVSLQKQQKYITQIDDFRLTQDRVYADLNTIILDYIKNNHNKLATNLKKYYKSVINMNPINYSKQLSKDAVSTIDDLIHTNNMWKLLAHINSDEMISSYAPFVWSLNPDDKEPNKFRCSVSPHQFTLIDITVYYDDGKNNNYKQKYKEAFSKYCGKLFDVCLGKGHGFNGGDIFDVEVDIFETMGCSDVLSGDEKRYNKVSANDCLDKYGFDWKEFTSALGFKTTPSFFLTSSLNYLKCGTDLMTKNWNSPKWRTYWVWILLSRICRLTKDWEKITYEFFGSFQRGQGDIVSSEAVSASLYMSVPFNKFLTDKYVEKYENPKYVKYTKTMCEDLVKVFRRILMRNSWMSPKTKKYALFKLSKFKFIIGHPENLREDPLLDYDDMLYDNLIKLYKWRHVEFIKLEGKSVIDIPMMDWTQYPVKMTGTQAYIVNASYTPSKNGIYINLGYLQKPFVDLDARGIEYNLAHLGFTISHEMSHGFDDMGSQYDANGVLNDWWSVSDKKKFKQKQIDIIKQYEEFAARDKIDFDASIGIGEDMADISGLAICDEYLRDFHEYNKNLYPIRQLSFEAFYTYFAFQQKQFVGKKALDAQLKTNPHPLDKYRCNIPLSRSQIFRALYDVKKKDSMWWHNTDTIW
ncbi:M13 family metallopeptidase [bacterium]|nr:M13 family metallopeptidase [bacterium]